MLAKELRKRPTDAERLLWQWLRRKQLGHHFRRQQPIGRYIVDFACLRSKLIVELDGGGHALPDQVIHDAARTQWLEREGYRVLRFWNHEVLRHTEAVLRAIWSALHPGQAASATGSGLPSALYRSRRGTPSSSSPAV